MKITDVETILIEEFPNLVYVRVHTDASPNKCKPFAVTVQARKS